jgi:multicomponent Na+:H+ antiporter subunit B
LKLVEKIIVLLFGAILMYCTLDFPDWNDPGSPASTHVSPYYIEHTLADTAVPNIVTAVLADYRGYDTMFETIVIFTAVAACFLMLRQVKADEPEARMYRHIPTGTTFRIKKGGHYPRESADFERIDLQWVPYGVVVKTTCRKIIPFIQLFALYVIAHGHHSPGGGFQGGVILGASIIVYAISHNLRSSLNRLGLKVAVGLCTLGVFLYAATGVLCMLLGGNFLDYGVLSQIMGVDPVMARSHGILIVEIGVGMAVMAAMLSLYYNLSSNGQFDEGL